MKKLQDMRENQKAWPLNSMPKLISKQSNAEVTNQIIAKWSHSNETRQNTKKLTSWISTGVVGLRFNSWSFSALFKISKIYLTY